MPQAFRGIQSLHLQGETTYIVYSAYEQGV